jgi:pyridoxal phosphate enzyme (YggS family)
LILDTIQVRYKNILEHIFLSAQSVGRDPDSVRLVVVTKRQPLEAIQEVIEAGARYLGENYADEALKKMIALQEKPVVTDSPYLQHPATKNKLVKESRAVQWHIIGHVQSRKAHLVGEHFDYLHSLDSVKLASRLDQVCAQYDRVLPVLLEMNVSGEQTKSGWPAWDETRWSDLLPDIYSIAQFGSLSIKGLMTMAPYFDNPESARPYYRRLRQLQEYLILQAPQMDWNELSMGMSGDYEIAIQEGATWVRVGQAILGPRLR